MMRLVWVLLIVATIAALFFYGINRDPNARDEIDSGRVGKLAPTFELATYERFQSSYGDSLGIVRESESVSSSESETTPDAISRIATQDTPLVLNFWASWCGPCRDEAPLLEEMWGKYQSEVLFIGVNTQDPRQQNATNFLDEFNWSFPNVVDSKSRIGIQYGVYGLPETFFIQKDGTVSYRHPGPLTKEIFEREVKKIIP